MNLRYDGVGMFLVGRLLDGRTAVIWLLPAILVVIAIVLPVVAWKRYPPTDPWFEERRRVRGSGPTTINGCRKPLES